MGTDTVKDMNKVGDVHRHGHGHGHGQGHWAWTLNFTNVFAVTTHCYYKLSRTYELLNLYT